MKDEVLDSYLEKWLLARPVQRLAMPYVDRTTQRGHLALAALEHAWIEAAYDIREPDVVRVKLNWWVEELAAAAPGGGRHPLTRALFASPGSERIERTCLLAPVQAALAQAGSPTPPDHAALVSRARAFHGALGRLETQWWFGAQASPERAQSSAVADHLLQATIALAEHRDRDSLALPMSCLARHGLDRDALESDSPARRAAVREHLQVIRHLVRQAQGQGGPLSVFRDLQLRENARRLDRALRARDPLAVLQARANGMTVGSAWRAWSAARASRRQVRD